MKHLTHDLKSSLRPVGILVLCAGLGGCGFLQRLSEPHLATRSAPVGSWKAHLSDDIPYYNLGDAPVPVFHDRALTRPAGHFARGEGGHVQTCRDDDAVCRIVDRHGTHVWVRITRLAGVAG